MSATEHRRTQAERRSQSEAALLDAAAELIAERGVEGASLASIGERAGVSRGLPTHHFGSKDALVARLSRRAQNGIARATLDALGRAEQTVDEISAIDLLHLTVDSYLDLIVRPTADQRALIVMWGSTFPSRASVEGMVEADRRSLEGWAELIGRGQDEGSIRTGINHRATAVVLMGLLRGVAAVMLTDAEASNIEEVRRTCHDWITAALAPAGPARGRSTTATDRRHGRRAAARAS
jgi:AcrR family transcriptional regulator